MTYFEKIIDVQTNEEILRPYSKEEVALVESELQKIAEELQKIETNKNIKSALLDKLGITDEEAKLLLS